MGWKHQCRMPGNLRIKLRRARGGAIWSCHCGEYYTLHRRSPIPGHSHWEWQTATEPPEHHEDPERDRRDTHSETERAWRDDTADVMGFRPNQ